MKKNKKQPQVIRLKIDGPASILENSLKYGLQLASFFPALCRLKKWKISSAFTESFTKRATGARFEARFIHSLQWRQ